MQEQEMSREDQLFLAIGRISQYFNVLETYASVLVWTLIGAGQQVGEIITSELSFRNLLALLSSLYRLRKTDKKDINKLTELLKKAEGFERKRNQIIHSIWAVNMTDPQSLIRYKVTAKRKNGLKHTLEKKTVDELNRIADEMVFIIKTISEITINELHLHHY